MRRRLSVAIVGVVAGALILAGLGTLVLVRRAAAHETRAELVRQARALAEGAEEARRPGVVGVLRQVLRLEGFSLVRMSPDGRVLGSLPNGVSEGDLAPPQLLAGQTVSGVNGSVAYAAAPIRGGRAPVAVLLTRTVSGVGRASGYFALAAGVALLAAVAVADRVGRRITEPLTEAERATRRIAAGDLAARAPEAEPSYPELASLTRSVNAMAADLERARTLERQFLLSVSHDLRTPLTSIRGFAEAIADGVTADTARAAQVIGAEARRLERLVEDLLDLANLEARRFTLRVGRVDAAEVVADTAEGFGPSASEAGLTLAVDASRKRPLPVAADPERLAQVVANLVENALKFARSRIEVGVARRDGTVEISVTDDGPGIPADEVPGLFARPYRAGRAPVRQVGSGLGLAIVAELVSAMGGGVEVNSRSGDTRLAVALPAWDAQTSGRTSTRAGADPPSQRTSASTGGSTSRRT